MRRAGSVSKRQNPSSIPTVSTSISTRSWEGQDGKKNYTTEVIANEVSFGESKRSQDGGGSYQAPYSGGGSNSASVPTPAAPPMPADLTEDDFSPLLDTDDDLPF